MSNFTKIKDLMGLRKTCPLWELFCSAFSHIRTEYGKIRSIHPYSVRIWENADQTNSKYYKAVWKYIYLRYIYLLASIINL